MTVYLTDSNYENAKFLLRDIVPLCAESSDHDILPISAIEALDQKVHEKCVKKGIYDLSDMGLLRFEELVPNIHELGDYYFSIFTIVAEDELICNITFYAEWGYL